MTFEALRNQFRIIIINDVPRLVEVYNQYFEKVGLKVVAVFSSAREMLSLVESSKTIDDKLGQEERRHIVILVDDRTLETDSEDAFRKLRRLNPNQKIILATTKDPSSLGADENLFDSVIRKPFTISKLMGNIQKMQSKIFTRGTVVLSNPEEISRLRADILSDSKEKLCQCRSSLAFEISVNIPNYNPSRLQARGKGLQVQLITEINRDNLSLCKQLIGVYGVQIRHLEGVRKNFSVWDEKHFEEVTIATNHPFIVKQLVYSNLEPIVRENQYLFDTLWEMAIPGAQKIQELESISEPLHVGTVLTGRDVVSETRIKIISNSRKYLDLNVIPELAIRLLDPPLRELCTDAISRGVRCRVITSITSDNLTVCGSLIRLGMEVRHMPALKGESVFNERESMTSATLESLQTGLEVTSVIYSTHPQFAEQRQAIFDALWASATPFSDRMKEIEQTH